MSAHNSRTRIEEIRAENHQGDVSAKDIEWLCDVAEAAHIVEAKVRYALTTPGLRPDVATVLDRALGDLRRMTDERGVIPTGRASSLVMKCASLSPRNGVPCQLPSGHEGSHYSSERNTGDWSVGLAEALRGDA